MVRLARRGVRVCGGCAAGCVGCMVGVLLIAPGARLLGVRDLQRTHPEYTDGAAANVAIARALARDGY